MTKTMQPHRRIELLLNTLQGERYVRRALLTELLDEFAVSPFYDDAAFAARAILDRLDVLSELQYEHEISLLCDLACERPSGVRLVPVPARPRVAAPRIRVA
jgi:hypothetical protein